METKEKQEVLNRIEKKEIRIENGRLVGLGNSNESIDIASLDELVTNLSKNSIAERLSAVVFNIGALGVHLFFNGEGIADEGSAIWSNIPSTDDLYYLQSVHEFFRK